MPNQNFETFGEVRNRFPDVVFRQEIDEQASVFVKTSHRDVFASEAAGLDALQQTNAIRVAEVLAVGKYAGKYVLVLEAIESQAPTGDFFELFARKLVALHRHGSRRFGFDGDNFLGQTFQPNPMTDDWVKFWSESRLGYQLKLAEANNYGGSELQRLGGDLLNRLDSLIGNSNEKPALIHGDLWSGNWLCDANNQPALIDPAAYFANREAEFGMTTLFGGLPEQFYEAYDEAWPMEQGWRERVSVYRLYHLLNHLNLFGRSYLADCLEILRRFQ